MIDLKQQPTSPAVLLSNEADEPAYPPGLCLYLDTDTLRKLGIGESSLPKVGQSFTIHGKVEVVSVAKEAGTIETDHQVELQVTHLELGNEQQMAYGQVSRMYGG